MKSAVPTYFPRSFLDLIILCERGLNGTEINSDRLSQTETCFNTFSRSIPVQLAFVLFAVVFIIVYYYIILPRDYSPRTEKYAGVLNFINNSAPRKIKHRKKLEEFYDDIKRSSKIGNVFPVFPNGWYVITASDEVSAKWVTFVSALGENLAVFRTTEGAVRVVDAYCAHLDADMANGGKVKENCLECNFYGWRLDGSTSTKVPFTEKVPDFARVRTWKSCEVNDCVFVWYHAEGEEPTWEPRPWEKIRNKWYVGRFQHWVRCHIQDTYENASDFTHFKVVHGPFLYGGSRIWDLCNRVLESLIQQQTTCFGWKTDGRDEPHELTINISHQIRFIRKFTITTGHITIRQFGPGYQELSMELLFGKSFMITGITPHGPLRQKMFTRFYSSSVDLLFHRLFIPVALDQIERDIAIWDFKKFMDSPLLLREEKSIMKFRRWYSQFYTANSPRYTPQH